jgi:hypothetical protein
VCHKNNEFKGKYHWAVVKYDITKRKCGGG